MGLRELTRSVSKKIVGRGVTHAYLSTIESRQKSAPRVPILEGLASVLAASPLEIRRLPRDKLLSTLLILLRQQPYTSELLTQVEMGTASSRDILAALRVSYDETPLPLDMPKCLLLMPDDIFMAFHPNDQTQTKESRKIPATTPCFFHLRVGLPFPQVPIGMISWNGSIQLDPFKVAGHHHHCMSLRSMKTC